MDKYENAMLFIAKMTRSCPFEFFLRHPEVEKNQELMSKFTSIFKCLTDSCNFQGSYKNCWMKYFETIEK